MSRQNGSWDNSEILSRGIACLLGKQIHIGGETATEKHAPEIGHHDKPKKSDHHHSPGTKPHKD